MKTQTGEGAGRVPERVRFLSRIPPFKGLEADELARVAAAVVERAVPEGEAILVEGGPPGHELFVVRSGTLELVYKDAIVSVATSGEGLTWTTR